MTDQDVCEMSFPDSTVANFGFPAKARLLINPEDGEIKLNGFRVLRRRVVDKEFAFVMAYGGDNSPKHAKCYLCLVRIFKGSGVYLPKISQSLSFSLPGTAVASDMVDYPETTNTNYSKVVISTGTERIYNINVDFEAVSFFVDSRDRQESAVDSLMPKQESFEYHYANSGPEKVFLADMDKPFSVADETVVEADEGKCRPFENMVARHLTSNCGTLRVVSREEEKYVLTVVSSRKKEKLGYAAARITLDLGERVITSVGGVDGVYGYTALGMEDGKVVLLYLVNGNFLKKEFEPDLNDGAILQVEVLENEKKILALTTSGLWVLDMEEEAVTMADYYKSWIPHLIYIVIVVLAHYLKG